MERTRYLPAVDGMRGVAAILVLDYHVALYFSFSKGALGSAVLIDHFYLAVDLFFIMSGFVIAHSFDARMAVGMTILEFMVIRLRRLYPMVLAGVFLGSLTLFAFLLLTPQIGLVRIEWAIGAGLLLLPTTALAEFKPWSFPANSPHWSLSYEMIMSFAYAATFRFLKGRIFAFVTLSALFACIAVAYSNGGLNLGFRISDFAVASGRIVFPFFLGVALRRSRFFKPGTIRYGYVAIPLLLLIVINPIPATLLYDTLAVTALLPALVWLTASAKPMARSDALAALAGEVSYPLYALHFPLVVAFSNCSKYLKLSHSQNLALAAFCAVFALIFSFFVYKTIDVPVRRYLGRARDAGPARPQKMTHTITSMGQQGSLRGEPNEGVVEHSPSLP